MRLKKPKRIGARCQQREQQQEPTYPDQVEQEWQSFKLAFQLMHPDENLARARWVFYMGIHYTLEATDPKGMMPTLDFQQRVEAHWIRIRDSMRLKLSEIPLMKEIFRCGGYALNKLSYQIYDEDREHLRPRIDALLRELQEHIAQAPAVWPGTK